jgi:carbon monoxide dehydrogenase subunit G
VRNTLDLAPASPGATLVRYRSDVRVLGRLGSVGDAVMKVKAKQVAADFAANVRAALGRPA